MLCISNIHCCQVFGQAERLTTLHCTLSKNDNEHAKLSCAPPNQCKATLCPGHGTLVRKMEHMLVHDYMEKEAVFWDEAWSMDFQKGGIFVM